MYRIGLSIALLLFSLHSLVRCQCEISNCINCTSTPGCVWCTTYPGGATCITEAEKIANCNIEGVDTSYDEPLTCPDYCQGYTCDECVDIPLCGFCYDAGYFSCLRNDSGYGSRCVDFRTDTSPDGCTPPNTCEQQTTCSSCTGTFIYTCGWCHSGNSQDAFCYDIFTNGSACDNTTKFTFTAEYQCADPCLDLNNECGQCTESSLDCGFCHDYDLCLKTDIIQWKPCKDYVTNQDQNTCAERIACESLTDCTACVDNIFDTCSWCATSQTCTSMTGGGSTNDSACEGGASDQSQCLARANEDSSSNRITTSFLF